MIDSIRIISEGLTAINEKLADMMPGADFDALEMKRNELRAKLDFLTKLFFKESADRFIQSDHELVKSVNDMKSALGELDSMRNTLKNVGRFLTAVNSLVQTATPFG